MRTTLVLGAVLLGCGSSGPATTTSAATTPPGTTPPATTPPAAPGATLPSSPTSGELASCTLAATTVELGAAGDGVPSAPVAVARGFLVAFTRYDEAGASHLWVQRVTDAGVVEEASLLRSGVHASRPFLFVRDGVPYAVVVLADGTTSIVPVDPDALAATVAVAGAPEDVAFGPRGLVWTDVDAEGEHRTLHRDGAADATFVQNGGWPEPREETLASGPTFDAVLVRDGDTRSLVVVPAGGAPAAPATLFTATAPTWGEASIAAGASGVAVVRTGPGIGDLEVHLTDGTSAPRVVSIAPPRGSTRPPDALVRRHPRIIALGAGWVVTYWDGLGPSLVRLDASGAISADAIELRSGDERGGHTDARAVATDAAIAVTWQVGPPDHGHGLPEEEPRRPGPRMAILRCAP